MSAPEPMTYTELKSWAEIRPDIFLTGRTADLIIRVDGVFRSVWSKWSKNKREDE